MHLSQLWLNLACWQVRWDVAHPYDMHRTLLNAFPQGKVCVDRDEDDAAGVLFRVEQSGNSISALVQSKAAPDWSFLDGIRDRSGRPYLLPTERVADGKSNSRTLTFDLTDKLAVGRVFAFRLRANPTKRLGKSAEYGQGKRVGLYIEAEQLDWLRRKGEQGGFRVLRVLVSGDTRIANEGAIKHNDQMHDLQLFSVQFDGLLRVEAPDLLCQAVEKGIGSGKAFGFGLLSLARA